MSLVGGVADLAARVVRIDDAERRLSEVEAVLLGYLASKPSVPITRRELLEEVWGYHPSVVSRTVDTTVMRLRRKVERDPSEPFHIRTVPNEGYAFHPAPRRPLQIGHLCNTPFVGRQAELRRIRSLRERGAKWITIVGPPGIGKTRLLLEAPEVDAVVDADGLVDVRAVLRAIADTYELDGTTADAVGSAMPTGSVIALDDIDPTLPDLAQVVPRLMESCRDGCWMVTSRGPLSVPGEVVFELGAMSDEDSRALADARVDAMPVDPNHLATALSLADGVPLAIDVALNHLGLLEVDGLSEDSTWQPVLDRVTRAWENADVTEHRALARVSCFEGDFPADLGSAACRGLDGDPLLELRQHAWLSRVAGSRFRLLRPIRRAIVQLAAPMAEDRAAWVRAIHDAAVKETIKPQDRAHLLAAARIALEQQMEDEASELLLRAAMLGVPGALGDTMRALLDTAMASLGVNQRLTLALAECARQRGSADDALRYAREAIPGSDEQMRCKAEHTAGVSALALGRLEEAEAHLENAVAAARTLNMRVIEAAAGFTLGLVELSSTRIDEGIRRLERSVDLYKASGRPHLESQTMDYLGVGLMLAGRAVEAEAWFDSALAIALPLDDSRIIARVHNNRVLLAIYMGMDDVVAERVVVLRPDAPDDLGNAGFTAYTMALAAAHCGQSDARELANRALVTARRHGTPSIERLTRALLCELWFTQHQRDTTAELQSIAEEMEASGSQVDALEARSRWAWIDGRRGDNGRIEKILTAFEDWTISHGGLPCALQWHQRRLRSML